MVRNTLSALSASSSNLNEAINAYFTWDHNCKEDKQSGENRIGRQNGDDGVDDGDDGEDEELQWVLDPEGSLMSIRLVVKT